MTFTASFTDMHGISYIDAVFEITYAHYNERKTISSQHNEDQTENLSYTLDFGARYWKDQEAKDAEAIPLDFRCNGGCTKVFTDAPDTSDIKALAKNVMEVDILPNMV